MAFDLVQFGGYGSGTLGDVTDPTAQINSVAEVNKWTGGTATIYVKSIGIDGGFKDDSEVLFYIGGISDIDDGDTYYGRWCIASISTASGGTTTGLATLYLNCDLEDDHNFPLMNEIYRTNSNLECFAVSVPHFKNLTLNTGCSITPSRAGCPLVFKCSGTLKLNGGHIDLRNKGDMYSPWFNQELNGKLDVDKYSGWENSQTKDRLHVNSCDGAAFIIANKLNVADSSSRIGNPNFTGIQFCRGASDSRNLPTNATNVGGSTILLVAGTITNFNPAIIAKYRDSTLTPTPGYEFKGLASCYIASNTILRNDEGLYAYDCISAPSRLETLGIKSFGDGSDGASSLTAQLNNYAKITAIDSTGQVLTVADKTTVGAIPFALNKLVMIHKKNISAYHSLDQAGSFILAKIIGINGDDITIDTPIPSTFFTEDFSAYNWQILTIPQFTNYTLNSVNSATPAYDGSKGGIFAIAVNGTCDLSNGRINVENKGGGMAYKRAGLAFIGNAQDAIKLPIGEGHGSVFILAKNLTMNSTTRIGAEYSGAINAHGCFNGACGNPDVTHYIDKGGYKGGRVKTALDTDEFYVAWGGGGGEHYAADGGDAGAAPGGYGSNGGDYDEVDLGGKQGAHIMIIADTITGFYQSAISTGGATNTNTSGKGVNGQGYPGTAGYGAGATKYAQNTTENGFGAYNGGGSGRGGGGSSGWAFIYCNNVVNQDTTDTVYF